MYQVSNFMSDTPPDCEIISINYAACVQGVPIVLSKYPFRWI